MEDFNKNKLSVGLILIISAFLCIVIALYFIVNAHKKSVTELESIKVKK